MATEVDPIVNTWYQHLDKGQKFQIVAADEDESVIDIQYFDGDIEEIDLDDWYLMDLEQIESPEDVSGALDVSEVDDLGVSVTDTNLSDWDVPIQEIKRHEDIDMSEDIIGTEGLGEVASVVEPWDDT